MAMVRVEHDYRFEGPDGPRSLPELFDGRSQPGAMQPTPAARKRLRDARSPGRNKSWARADWRPPRDTATAARPPRRYRRRRTELERSEAAIESQWPTRSTLRASTRAPSATASTTTSSRRSGRCSWSGSPRPHAHRFVETLTLSPRACAASIPCCAPGATRATHTPAFDGPSERAISASDSPASYRRAMAAASRRGRARRPTPAPFTYALTVVIRS
jgi:Bacterial protein of unknown function (DUF899)